WAHEDETHEARHEAHVKHDHEGGGRGGGAWARAGARWPSNPNFNPNLYLNLNLNFSLSFNLNRCCRWYAAYAPRFPLEVLRAIPPGVSLVDGWNAQSLQGAGAVVMASLLFSGAVFLDNACLMVVNTSFFQVARGLTLPLVTLLGPCVTKRQPPLDLLLPCLLCVLGFALGAKSQPPELWAGTAVGVLSSILTAAYTLLLAQSGPSEGWRMTYTTNRNASLLLIPAAVYLGIGRDVSMLEHLSFLIADMRVFLIATAATVLPAVAGVATLGQAQAGLGPTELAMSSVGRAAFSHVLAFRIWGNSPIPVGEAGCCLVLAGLATYASRRGGAAVAQAGHVATPATAKAHLLVPGSGGAGCPNPWEESRCSESDKAQ
ncbi:unnamed protein product, partial [Discosporangium mesarthrocarpum]